MLAFDWVWKDAWRFSKDWSRCVWEEPMLSGSHAFSVHLPHFHPLSLSLSREAVIAGCVPSLIYSHSTLPVQIFYARIAAIKYWTGQWNKDRLVLLFSCENTPVPKMCWGELIQTQRESCSYMNILKWGLRRSAWIYKNAWGRSQLQSTAIHHFPITDHHQPNMYNAHGALIMPLSLSL